MDWGLRTIRRHWAITGIIVAFIALGAAYSVVTPIFEASDELWHYPFVKHLADSNGLPVQDASTDQPWRQEGSQPPLYYALSALATFWINTDDAYEGHPPLLWYNPHVDNGVLTADGNTNLVVHSQQEAFPWHGTALAVHLIRFLSVLMGATTVLLTYLTALEIFPGRKDLALGAAAINAFTPMFLFISGAVNNDNLVVPLCSLALLMMVRIANRKSQISSPRWALLGLVVGLAILTKESAIGLLALAALTITYVTYRQRSMRTLLEGGPIMMALAAIISGWWFVRNWKLYGDPLGLNVFLDILGRRHPPATLRQLWGERIGFAMSYWGLFGGVNVPMDTWIYRLLNLLAIVAAIGVLIFLIRKLIRDRLLPDGLGESGDPVGLANYRVHIPDSLGATDLVLPGAAGLFSHLGPFHPALPGPKPARAPTPHQNAGLPGRWPDVRHRRHHPLPLHCACLHYPATSIIRRGRGHPQPPGHLLRQSDETPWIRPPNIQYPNVRRFPDHHPLLAISGRD